VSFIFGGYNICPEWRAQSHQNKNQSINAEAETGIGTKADDKLG
jgi:hypothetical protein